MERFVLTTRRNRAGRLLLRLEMKARESVGPERLIDRWEVECQAGGDKVLMILETAERCYALSSAERPGQFAGFDGGRKSFLDLLHTHCGFGFPSPLGFPGIGEWAIQHRDGMRLALAFALAGKANTVGKRRALAEGLGGLPEEAVLYWFTLCFYGRRTRAGRAALFTLATAKPDAP